MVRSSTDVRLEADPDQLEQLLINIVRNAVDATIETGGKVWIDWAQHDGYLPGPEFSSNVTGS